MLIAGNNSHNLTKFSAQCFSIHTLLNPESDSFLYDYPHSTLRSREGREVSQRHAEAGCQSHTYTCISMILNRLSEFSSPASPSSGVFYPVQRLTLCQLPMLRKVEDEADISFFKFPFHFNK